MDHRQFVDGPSSSVAVAHQDEQVAAAPGLVQQWIKFDRDTTPGVNREAVSDEECSWVWEEYFNVSKVQNKGNDGQDLLLHQKK